MMTLNSARVLFLAAVATVVLGVVTLALPARVVLAAGCPYSGSCSINNDTGLCNGQSGKNCVCDIGGNNQADGQDCGAPPS